MLKHWARKPTLRPATPGGPATPGDKNEAPELKAAQVEAPTLHWTKYDIKVTGPEYTDEEYESYLKSDQWTKEETDYLIHLALDFDLRWVVVADRYDFKPQETGGDGDSMAVTMAPKPRSMEDMKARYYEVASKMMALHQPPSSMSHSEFDLLETMKKFDPVRETTRKKLAEALMARTADEIKEEELLLTELKRLVTNEDHFLQERQELFDRLEHPVSQGSIAMYESSAGLVQLMQTLLSADKNKKRRSTAGGSGDAVSSPAQPAATPTTASHAGRDHRSSVSGAHPRKGMGAAAAAGPNVRQLSARDEAKYGIVHHERLSSGVVFRQTRIEKLVLAKSAAQNQKLQEGLAELGIPARAVMPTGRVCAEYERVVAGIQTLLDARKVSEKIANETRILRAQREVREQQEKGQGADGQDKGYGIRDGAEKGSGESEAVGNTSRLALVNGDRGGVGSSKDEDIEMKDGVDNESQVAAPDKTSDAEEEGKPDDEPDDEQDDEPDDEPDEEPDEEPDDEPDDEAERDEDEAEPEAEPEVADTDDSDDERADEQADELREEDDEDEEDEAEDGEDDGEKVEDEGEEPDEEDAADSSRAASSKGTSVHKRSASVFSAVSERSSKKARK